MVETISDPVCRLLLGVKGLRLDTVVCCRSVSGSSCQVELISLFTDKSNLNQLYSQGDSGSFVGGPRNGRMEQDALVSFGSARTCSRFPMGFTEVYLFKRWIIQVYKMYDNME